MQWTRRKEAKEAVDRLERERESLLEYQEKIGTAKERQEAGGLSGEDIENATAELEQAMPDEVRGKLQERKAGLPPDPADRAGARADAGALQSDIRLTSSFTRGALNELAEALNRPNDEFTPLRPSASTPAPK